MKISFMTFACPTWTADEVIAGAKRHGYDGIEWRMDGGHAHGVELSLSHSGRAELRQKLADAGIESACLATSLKFVDAQAVADTPARLDLAASLNAPGLRVFCGSLPEGVTLDDAIARVAENLSQVADLAKERGVALWLETHDSFNRAAPVAAVLSRVNHPSVAANWDNMHPFFNGETLVETEIFLHSRIAHTHFHDAKDRNPSNIVPFGDGVLPCARMLRMLQVENFDGYLSGEWFNENMGATPDDALANYISGLRKLMLETAGTVQPILTEEFWSDGRGPTLKAVRYAMEGTRLRGVEYFNPDNREWKHLRFEGVQVWMFTPHEIHNWELDWPVAPGVAAICLGKSEWLQSFAPQHLGKCQHFQLKFYDEFLDVICERITFGQGKISEK